MDSIPSRLCGIGVSSHQDYIGDGFHLIPKKGEILCKKEITQKDW